MSGLFVNEWARLDSVWPRQSEEPETAGLLELWQKLSALKEESPAAFQRIRSPLAARVKEKLAIAKEGAEQEWALRNQELKVAPLIPHPSRPATEASVPAKVVTELPKPKESRPVEMAPAPEQLIREEVDAAAP